VRPNVETVGNQMPATEALGIHNELIECETDGRIVRGDNSARAGANDDCSGGLGGCCRLF
jgi:hypothetical protein